jgi:hypothetical protein
LKEELKVIREASEGNMDNSKDEANIVREKYKPQLDPMHEAMAAQKEIMDKSLASILNEGQNQKLSDLRTFQEANKMKKPPHCKGKGQSGPPKGPKEEH